MNGVLLAARRALLANWRLKLSLSAFLTLFFCVPYFTLQRATVFPVRQLAPWTIDSAIGFMPDWVWVYQSVYLLLAVIPWLSESEDDVRRYAGGFMLLSSIGFACFFFFPFEVPRPPAPSGDAMFRLLVSYDEPLNTFPSLHVGLALYTVLFGGWTWRRRLSPRTRLALIAVSTAWAAGIAFSALATKQHYLVDILAGAVLAYVSHYLAFNTSVQRSAHADSIPSRNSSGHIVAVHRHSVGAAAGRHAAGTRTRDIGGERPGSGPRGAAWPASDLRAGDS